MDPYFPDPYRAPALSPGELAALPYRPLNLYGPSPHLLQARITRALNSLYSYEAPLEEKVFEHIPGSCRLSTIPRDPAASLRAVVEFDSGVRQIGVRSSDGKFKDLLAGPLAQALSSGVLPGDYSLYCAFHGEFFRKGEQFVESRRHNVMHDVFMLAHDIRYENQRISAVPKSAEKVPLVFVQWDLQNPLYVHLDLTAPVVTSAFAFISSQLAKLEMPTAPRNPAFFIRSIELQDIPQSLNDYLMMRWEHEFVRRSRRLIDSYYSEAQTFHEDADFTFSMTRPCSLLDLASPLEGEASQVNWWESLCSSCSHFCKWCGGENVAETHSSGVLGANEIEDDVLLAYYANAEIAFNAGYEEIWIVASRRRFNSSHKKKIEKRYSFQAIRVFLSDEWGWNAEWREEYVRRGSNVYVIYDAYPPSLSGSRNFHAQIQNHLKMAHIKFVGCFLTFEREDCMGRFMGHLAAGSPPECSRYSTFFGVHIDKSRTLTQPRVIHLSVLYLNAKGKGIPSFGFDRGPLNLYIFRQEFMDHMYFLSSWYHYARNGNDPRVIEMHNLRLICELKTGEVEEGSKYVRPVGYFETEVKYRAVYRGGYERTIKDLAKMKIH
jgi:hypothetical protein